jgi:hypothetical protein
MPFEDAALETEAPRLQDSSSFSSDTIDTARSISSPVKALGTAYPIEILNRVRFCFVEMKQCLALFSKTIKAKPLPR